MKKIIPVVICIFLCSVLFTEEALWITAEDIPAWDSQSLLYTQDILKTLPKGTKVVLSNHIGDKLPIFDRDGCIEYTRDAYNFLITVDGKNYYHVEPKNIIPIDTPDLFDESFLTVAHYPSRYLLPSYFADVLKSGTRYTMYKYEKDYLESNDEYATEYDPPWWELPVITEEAVITQSFLRINLNGFFFVKRIEKIPNGYKVNVKRSGLDDNPFSPYDRLEYPLFFQFDGDYVDIYIDNLSNKVLSLTYVSPEFYEGVKTVISDDVPVDLSNLIWPRRADGSSDYDDQIIPRQELPQVYRDPLQDTSISVDETTTLEELEEVIAETASMDLLNNKDWYGRTPLQIALQESSNVEIIKLLLELQDDVDESLLLWAVGNSPEIISIVLNAGASLNTVDNRSGVRTYRMNALRIAEEFKYASYETLSKLIEMGWEDNSDGKIIWQERGKTYLTTDNLRLRAEEGVSGNPLFTLAKDTPVHILSIGNIEKIDEIIAYWVEVEVAEDTVDTAGTEVKKGTVGWCFGGYLTNENLAYEALSVVPPKIVPVAVAEVATQEVVPEIVAEEPKDVTPEIVATEAVPELENIEQANSITVWLLLGGGVLLLGAVGVIVVMRKKKK